MSPVSRQTARAADGKDTGALARDAAEKEEAARAANGPAPGRVSRRACGANDDGEKDAEKDEDGDGEKDA